MGEVTDTFSHEIQGKFNHDYLNLVPFSLDFNFTIHTTTVTVSPMTVCCLSRSPDDN